MREELYFALKLYTERLNAGVPEKEQVSVTTVNGRILRSEVGPIPRELLEEGKEIADRASNFGLNSNRFQTGRVFHAPELAAPKTPQRSLSGGEPVDTFEEKPPKSGEEFYSGVVKF
jgi:hypothetical protein